MTWWTRAQARTLVVLATIGAYAVLLVVGAFR